MEKSRIRRAVGAIVQREGQFLLIHKVKMMNSLNGPEKINPRWDFPKGGVKSSDIDLNSAILRELKEETGSENYAIKKMFEDTIVFQFPDKIKEKIGFDSQEVTMFLVDFLGHPSELKSQDEEIDDIRFFSKEEVLNMIEFEDSRSFFKNHV